MKKEEELLAKRMLDLAERAEQRGIVTFSDFLGLHEQTILHQTLPKASWIHVETFGGYEGAERQIAAFVPDALSYGYGEGVAEAWRRWEYPIACILVTPSNPRFAEELTHRDILGALMSLGFERDRLGDIALCDGCFYLFCHQGMAELICRELDRIRHTSVECRPCSLDDFHYEPKLQPIRGSVASVRLDAVLAVAFSASRSGLLSLIGEGCVFVNGRMVTSNGYGLKEGDIVSVRGQGKFRYNGTVSQTKKGRSMVEVLKYV